MGPCSSFSIVCLKMRFLGIMAASGYHNCKQFKNYHCHEVEISFMDKMS